MPYDATGIYSRVHNWGDDRDNGIRILADRHDEEDNSIAGALNQAFLRSGIVPMTGPVVMNGNAVSQVRAGTPLQPGITFELDVDTGFYQPAAGQIGVVINGAVRGLFTDAGLSITGNLTASGDLNFSGVVGGNPHFTGNVAVDGTITSNGDIVGHSALWVDGLGTFGNINSSGTMNFNILNVAGTTTLQGPLTVYDTLWIESNGYIGGGLGVGSSITTAGSLTATYDVNANQNMNVVGNIGVGGTGYFGSISLGAGAPSQALHIYRTGGNEAMTRYQNDNVTFDVGVSGSSSFVYGRSNTSLILGTNNNGRVFILGNGNMGIRQGNPMEALDIGGNLTLQDGAFLYTGYNGGTWGGGARAGLQFDGTSQFLGFWTAGIWRGGWNAAGFLGVGMTPANPLDVNGKGRFVSPNDGTTGAVIIRDSAGDPGAGFVQFVNNANTVQYGWLHYAPNLIQFGLSYELARFQGDDFLVGTTTSAGLATGSANNPGVILGRNGGIDSQRNTASNMSLSKAAGASDNNYIVFNHSGGGAGSISYAGSGTIVINYTSDRRLKTNIAPANDPGSIIDAIEVVQHDWTNPDFGHVDYAIIAQDLVNHIPIAVKRGSDSDTIEKPEDTWGADPAYAVWMLLKEVQNLRKRVAALGG